MAASLVIVTVLILGGIAAWIYRDTAMKAPLPIVTLALLLALGYGVFTHDRDQAAEKRRDDCVARVERSIGNRGMWTDLGELLTQNGKPDSAAVIRRLLDKNLPALSLDNC